MDLSALCLRPVCDCITMCPDSKVHGASMGPIWGRQDPDGPHVGPMNFAIRVHLPVRLCLSVNTDTDDQIDTYSVVSPAARRLRTPSVRFHSPST